MSDINKLIIDSIPSNNKSISSNVNFESLISKMNLIVTHEAETNTEKTPFMKQKAFGMSAPVAAGAAGAASVGTAGYMGMKALAARTKNIEDAKAKEIAKAVTNAKKVQLNQMAAKGQYDLPNQHVADVSKNTLAGKSGEMTSSMGKAAGQWGQTLKSGMGGVADFAQRNPHLALAATALGGVAALKKLRRK